VKVYVSEHNKERYMLSDSDTIEEIREADLKGKKAVDADKTAHEKWFAEAKAYRHTVGQGEILASARTHLDNARNLPSPVADGTSMFDSRWSAWADSYVRGVADFTSGQDVLAFAQSAIPFDHRTNIEGHKYEFEIYEKLVYEEFPYRFDTQSILYDNPRSIPETLLLKDGRLTSNVFYWHMRIMFRCQEDVKPLESILEIGGGYGSLARLWMINKTANIKRYVIVDLPESLFFSEVCLRSEFGDDVGYWEGKDPGTRIVLLPVARLNEYHAKSDLVINVGSMQEMSDSWIDWYMTWLDIYQPKFFYSLNYMGQSILHLYESRTFWAPRPSSKWTTRSLSPDIPIVRMMCSGRDFAEALYEFSRPTRKFSEWSVLKGCYFNRATYLEGLELLRQNFSHDNAEMFLAVVTKYNDLQRLMVPKEILFIASLMVRETNDPRYKKLVDKLSEAKKIGTH
jgi:hypothetical protein